MTFVFVSATQATPCSSRRTCVMGSITSKFELQPARTEFAMHKRAGPIHDDDLAHGRFSVWVAGWRVVRAKALTPDWLRVPEAGKAEDTLVPKPQRTTIHRRARRSRNPLARDRFWVGQLRLREVSTRDVYSAPAVGLGGPGFRPWRTESRSWSGVRGEAGGSAIP